MARRSALIGLAIVVAFIAGALVLRGAASEKVSRLENACLQAFDAALLAPAGSGRSAAFAEAGECYHKLLRAQAYSREAAFRAQAAGELAESAPGALPPGAEEKLSPDLRAGLELLLQRRYRNAARAFAEIARGEGDRAALARRYRDLASDLVERSEGQAAPSAQGRSAIVVPDSQ